MLPTLFVLAASVLPASAGLIPRQQVQTPCSFVMNAVGTANGSIVEDHVGEDRIGGTYPQGTYYIVNGTLYDGQDHNCIIQSQSRQLQCVAGALGAPTVFSFADDGNLLANGTETWLACAADGPGDDGSYNIFSADLGDVGCNAITLRTGGFNCTALGRPSSSSSTTPATATGGYGNPAPPSTSAPASTSITTAPSTTGAVPASCPTDISGSEVQNPHLIVPTSPNASDHQFGNSYAAYISPINSTLFNYDIPAAAPYTGKCALIFTFPYGGVIYFSGTEEEQGEKGGIDFALMQQVANVNTTYNTMGAVRKEYGTTAVYPGNNYTIATFDCQTASTLTFLASSKGNVEIDFYQQKLPAMGPWIVPCA